MADIDNQINQVLATLNEREQKILRLRFGLDDGRSRSYSEVAKDSGYNVTRERIRQIEGKGMRRLRHPSRSRQLNGFPHLGDSPTDKLLRAIFGE